MQLFSTPRLSRHFVRLSVPAPAVGTLQSMLSSLLALHFEPFAAEVQQGLRHLIKAIVAAFEQMPRLFPVKGGCRHYNFGIDNLLGFAQVSSAVDCACTA